MGMGGFPQATRVDTDLTNTPVSRQEEPGSGGCLRSSRGASLLTGDWASLLMAANSVGRVGANSHLRIPASPAQVQG